MAGAAVLGETFPWSTLFVNVTGSFVIGFLLFADGRGRAAAGRRRTGVCSSRSGICGGYTTFSSFSLQTLGLLRDGQWLAAGWNAFGSLALCLVAVWLGTGCAALLNPKF